MQSKQLPVSVDLKNERSSFGPEESAESKCQSPADDTRPGLTV